MTSVVSQSSKSLARIANEKRTTSMFDNIMFAYFDQMTQSTSISNSLIYIVYLFICFQTLDMCMWDWNPLDKIFFFSDNNTDQNAICISIISFFALTLFAFTFPIVFYKQRNQFMKWSLVLSRFCLEIVVPIFLGPLAWEFGNLFAGITDGSIETTTLIYLILLVIITIFFISIFLVSQLLLGNSAFMSRSPLQCSRPSALISQLMMMTILIFMECIFEFLPDWAWYILCIIHILLAIYLIVTMLDLPFFQYWVNGVIIGLNATTVVSDILWMSGLDFLYRVIPVIPVFAISVIISEILIYKKVKETKKLLEIPELTDNYTLLNYLADINADSKMDFYLHVGLKEHSPLFVNFSLVKYSLDRRHVNRVLESCIRATVLFPSQASVLNVLYNALERNLKPSYGSRFLLFQIYRIKLLRQSSSSVVSSSQLEQMKELTKGLRGRTENFWVNNDLSFAALGQLQKDVNLCAIKWNQAIKDFPNSQMHRDEYVKFLVDVTTDFQEACKHHYITGLIESGHNFAIDYSFRSLIAVCPEYLKKGLVDINGNLIQEKKKKGNSSSSGNKQSLDSFTTSSELDAKLEESIGKTMIKQAKLRLTLQTTLKTRKSNNLQKMTLYSFVSGIIGIVVFVALYLVFKDYFDFRASSNSLNSVINEFQLKFVLTAFYQTFAWANSTTPQRFDVNMAYSDVTEPAALIYKPLWEQTDFYFEMGITSYESRSKYSDMIERLCQMSEQGVDIYTLTAVVLNEIINMTICVKFAPSPPILVNLKTLYVFTMQGYSLINTLGTTPDTWWTTNDYFCNAYVAFNEVSDSIKQLRYGLLENENTKAKEARTLMKWLKQILPACVAIVVLVPMIVLFIFSIQETNNLLKMMKGISNDHRIEASKTIFKANEAALNQADSANVVTGTNTTLALMTILDIIAVGGMIGLIVALLLECEGLNNQYKYVNYWSLLSSIRESVIVDTALSVYLAIFISGDHNVTQKMFTLEELTDRVEALMMEIRMSRSELEEGNSDVLSILGFDKEIDDLLNSPWCTPPTKNQTTHDSYACGGINQQLSTFDDFIMDIVQKVDTLHSDLKNGLSMDTFHIIVEHILPQLRLLDKYLDDLMVEFVSKYDSNYALFLALGLIISILFTCISIIIIQILSKPYDAALMILRRVSPIGICSNTKLIDYLLNRHSERASSEMTTTRAVLYNSTDAIFFLSHAGTIESMNLAVTKTLGYTPEQLLGQHFGVIFNEGDREKVTQQLQFMISKQSAPTYDDHFECLTDTEQIVPCFTMIFGMTGNSEQTGDVESFVVVVRDETTLVENQEEAERAKKQSEDLLFQILPRDIVVRLNQGEKDISFEVPSASIMFLDIVKFSDFSAALSPSEIMGTLSVLFGSYDECLNKYPLITKIKLIGDVYMCAAGLFTPNEPPQQHAEQLTKFGLDSLQIVDDTNLKLNISLTVRIGMNSGGPLIAGVLGTDKPVFDIIGDPINIASRLQSTDIPGRIQISQATYDLIQNMEFNIEPRGDVYLKGKGSTKAFLVKPLEGLASRSSSSVHIV